MHTELPGRNKMRTSLVLYFLMLLLVVLDQAAAANDGRRGRNLEMVWTPVASLPQTAPFSLGRHHPITFANETHAFLLTGTTLSQGATSDMYMYEEASDTWTSVGDDGNTLAIPFPPRSFGYGVVLPVADHPKAYLGFGAAPDGERLADFWEFDMQTMQWRQLANFPGPGRRHPAMNVVKVLDTDTDDAQWEIHVGLGDGQGGNYNDWWSYEIATNMWRQETDFPGSRRHHPFYFGLASDRYAGLGHSDGFSPYIERDWYRFETPTRQWQQEADFASYSSSDPSSTQVVTTEARVAGTQFSIELDEKLLGFVLSGDGDDHSTMETGEFHAFDPITRTWFQLPPHPGPSRWAPGSFVMRGTARAYFTCGFDRSSGKLFDDVWRINLAPLFESSSSDDTASTTTTTTTSPNGEDQDPDDALTSPTLPTNDISTVDEMTSSGSQIASEWFVPLVGALLSIAHLSGRL